MKELTKQCLEEVLEIVKSTKKFTKEHAPELAKEIVSEGILRASIELASNLLILVAIILVSLLVPDHNTWVIPGIAAFYTVASVLAIVAVSCCVNAIEKLLSIIIAPKLYIINTIGKLIK